MLFYYCLVESHYARDPNRSENPDVARLAQLFLSWPDSNEYHISECNMVRIKSFVLKSDLFVINV
jgi:hypothetical protein